MRDFWDVKCLKHPKCTLNIVPFYCKPWEDPLGARYYLHKYLPKHLESTYSLVVKLHMPRAKFTKFQMDICHRNTQPRAETHEL